MKSKKVQLGILLLMAAVITTALIIKKNKKNVLEYDEYEWLNG